MDVDFASGKLAMAVHSALRRRRRENADDVAVVLRAAFDNPDLLLFVKGWKEGSRLIPVVLRNPDGDLLAGVLLTKAPLVLKGEPMLDTVLSAIRSIEVSLPHRLRADLIIDCTANPDIVSLRRRGQEGSC